MSRIEKKPLTLSKNFPTSNHWQEIDGQEYVVIDNLETFEPFFLSIASPNEQWFFCSSHGSLAAGRNSPESSLFPYYTVDKIIDNWNTTGPYTAIVCNQQELWRPFEPLSPLGKPIARRLLKNVLGDELIFEEYHRELQIRFSYSWQMSNRYGLVRKVKLSNESQTDHKLRLIDGLDNFLPPGVSNSLQNEYSCLADAYKTTELECEGSLLIHRLAAGIIDAPLPMESLYATTVWAHGLGTGTTLTSRVQADRFLHDGSTPEATTFRAQRGAFFLARDINLQKNQTLDWVMVADNNQSQGDVGTLLKQLHSPEKLLDSVDIDLVSGSEKLRKVVASCDGFQSTADKDSDLYHYHNTLCNILRGGVPESGYRLEVQRFSDHLKVHNLPLFEKHTSAMNSMPAKEMELSDFLLEIQEIAPELNRHAAEYIPLILSRRHGDPSRPWNKFDIRLTDEQGQPIHRYEGNWRDIFQNWEALALSYPGYLGAFITKFLNASTADGYNPYRVTSDGIDWEIPEENNPWACIGYWGDHQIIYLLKLLERQFEIAPQILTESLNQSEYCYADVPYRIKPWIEILNNPRDAITFDQTRHETAQDRKTKIGADGLLLHDDSGEIVKATLIEKLLLPAVVKLGNLVPGGGIWLNTQKPEWNDANNALAGWGLSVVTVGYLYRYLEFIEKLIDRASETELVISSDLAKLIEALDQEFQNASWTATTVDDSERYQMVKRSGNALEQHRNKIYGQISSKTETITAKTIVAFIDRARSVLDTTLQLNAREDNLWHSYNILEHRDQKLSIRNLDLMLEGQVAVLSSGFLKSQTALELLNSLQTSRLRSDRHPTYLLYPDKPTTSYLDHNLIDPADIDQIPELKSLIASGDDRLVIAEQDGKHRFHPDLTNEFELRGRLTEYKIDEESAIFDLYEKVFQHQEFTGRSGSMFGYEGLGCVYWHMISKLMLAVQEVVHRSIELGEPDSLSAELKDHYFHVQAGLGYRQSAESYGAFPAEPYSHSSGISGAKQPGLTGQVKEGMLCRLGELGITYHNSQLTFQPHLLRTQEFGKAGEIEFSLCRVPITYQPVDNAPPVATVYFTDGSSKEFESAILDQQTTQQLNHDSGLIDKIKVDIPKQHLLTD